MTRDGTYWDIGTVPHVEPDRLSSIISALADFALVIDRDGKIISILAAPSHTALAALDQWENANVRDYLTTESVRKFEDALVGHLSNPDAQRSTELNHYDSRTDVEFPVAYTMHGIGSEETILLMGRDLRPIAEMQRQLVDAQIAVERDFELKRGYDTRFRVLMQTVQDAVVFVNVSSGKIIDANAAAANLLRRTVDELKDTEFAQLFEDQGRSELLAEMAASALSEGPSSVRLVDQRNERALNASPSFFRAAGTRTMLCRLTPDTDEDTTSGTLPHALNAIFEAGPDAIVLTDAAGRIASANEAFLDMTDTAHSAAVEGRSLANFLDRGSVDLKVLLDSTDRSGRTRIYGTKLKGQFEGLNPVNISVTPVDGAPDTAFAFVIRSTDPQSQQRDAEAHAERPHSAVDLVGNASLKEIVADTTDVIEKICIETAIELTSNNRVAAAEMLGLSRQSLYVKLRKYGLLSRPDED